jgi:hypothetical protein
MAAAAAAAAAAKKGKRQQQVAAGFFLLFLLLLHVVGPAVGPERTGGGDDDKGDISVKHTSLAPSETHISLLCIQFHYSERVQKQKLYTIPSILKFRCYNHPNHHGSSVAVHPKRIVQVFNEEKWTF